MFEEKKPRMLTRREMLKLSGLTGVGLLASACVVQAPPAPAAPPAAQQAPAVEEAPMGESDVTVEGALWILQGQDFHPSYNEYLRTQITQFAGEQDWPLDISYIAGFTSGSGEVEKIAAAVQSGNPPDLILHTLSAVQLRNLYALDPVSDVVEEIEGVFGQAAPQMYIDYFFEDQWWGVPYHQRSDGGWYRKDLFDAAGIDVQAIREYAALRDACLTVSDPGNETYGWGMTVNRSGDGNFLINRVKTGYGAAWQDETGQYIATNSPEMVEAMNFLKDVYTNPDYEPMLPPGVLAWNDTANNEAYLGGVIAFTQNAGTVYAKAVVDQNPVAPVTGFLKPPGGPVIQEFITLGAKNWMVLRGGKNPEASKQTILRFNADLGRYDEMLASSPAYALPCYVDLWEMSEYIKTDEVALQQKTASLDESGISSGIYPGPPSAAMVAIDESGAWNDMINSILTGTPTEEAVATAHERMVQIFQEFGLPGEQA
jgi:multiple sugar transport system substrate-binding protein